MLVLGNKIDRPEAISEGGLRGAFALDGQVTGKVGVLICRNDMISLSLSHGHRPHLYALSSTGECLFEGAERPTAGDFHVQRVEKTRLRGRFQMVVTVHRLTCKSEA